MDYRSLRFMASQPRFRPDRANGYGGNLVQGEGGWGSGAGRKKLVWTRPIRWYAVPRAPAAVVPLIAKPIIGFPCLLASLVIGILVVVAALLATTLTGVFSPNGSNPCEPLSCQYSCRLAGDSLTDYECYCAPGFELGGNGINCSDIDECLVPNECSNTTLQCINGEGSYTCGCGPGWNRVGDICEDVDECLTARCYGGSTCVNLEGTYRCDCPGNLVYNETYFECQEPPPEDYCATSPCPSQCLNTPTGYECICRLEGFAFDDARNACVRNPQCDCSGECELDRKGNYICKCDKSKGEFLARDGKTCIAFDLISGGITNADGDNTDYGEETSFYNLTSESTASLTFKCTVQTNMSINVSTKSRPGKTALVWLNNDDYLLPNRYLDPSKYIIEDPSPIDESKTAWTTSLTVRNPDIPDDLGTFKCKFICDGQVMSRNFEVEADIPPKPCLYEKYPYDQN